MAAAEHNGGADPMGPTSSSGGASPGSAPDNIPDTTERRFLSSTTAAYFSQLGRTLIRVGAELVLARLLLPADHGLFDRALGIVILAGAFRDLGLVYQVVRDERQPFGTVLVWVVGAGGVITALLSLASPLFAPLDPGLPDVLRVLSLYVLLDAVAVVPKVFFERRLEVGRLVVPELARGSLFALVAVTFAVQGYGVWSFVGAELAGAALFAVLVWVRAWGRMPLEPRLHLLGDLLRRSALLFLVWVFTLATPLVGRYVLPDSATVGNYNKAYLWALRLHAFVLPAMLRVFYPTLVEYRRDDVRFVEAYRLGTVALIGLETLAAYFLFFNAEVVLLDIVLGPGWEPAVPLLKILCFLPLIEPFGRLGGEVLKVRYEDRLWLVIAALNLASLIVFGVLFTQRWGATGMAWANFLLLGNLLMAWRMTRICGPRTLALVRDLMTVYALPLPLFLAVAWLFPPASWSRFVASFLVAGVALALLGLRFRGAFVDFFRPAAAPSEDSPT